MQQVLFYVPLIHLPVYGYGLMLFCAFVGCTLLAKYLCKREGIDADMISDLTIWLFVAGILGGRINYVIQYWYSDDKHIGFDERPILDVIKLWDGGLVLYGALFGGAAGYFAFYYRYLRKQGVSNWKMMDVIAPCIVLGVAFGRIGCLCTGCCYGNVAGETCPVVPIHFPAYTNTTPPEYTASTRDMIKRGYQTPLGFMIFQGSHVVEAVEPGTPAALAGLAARDEIVKVNGADFKSSGDLKPGNDGIRLSVRRGGDVIDLPAFRPTCIGLNPTQIFETISMCLLLFFMLSYYPYKRHDGELLVILMFVYGVHRYLNEMLRTDTDPVAFDLTYSQVVSIVILTMGAVLAYFVFRRPTIASRTPLPMSAPIHGPEA